MYFQAFARNTARRWMCYSRPSAMVARALLDTWRTGQTRALLSLPQTGSMLGILSTFWTGDCSTAMVRFLLLGVWVSLYLFFKKNEKSLLVAYSVLGFSKDPSSVNLRVQIPKRLTQPAKPENPHPKLQTLKLKRRSKKP